MNAGNEKKKEAPPELLLLVKWEEFTAWALAHTGRWPKSVRFHLTQRIAGHLLDVLEELIGARYVPAERGIRLGKANLLLERLRFLFRIARRTRVQARRSFETAMRGIDETGRMIGGWRKRLQEKK